MSSGKQWSRVVACRLLFVVGALFVAGSATAADKPADPPKPNIVLIFCDDLGYGDVGCFGATDIRTPNIDRLAAQGTRFTSFYVPQAVCTASRAGLMTGCYPNRVGLQGALNHVSKVGIAPEEYLLPEMLHDQGYATAIYGKWHLGDQPPFLPTRNGFDEFFGIPYSNDNGPLHGSQKGLPPLPLYEGEKIVGHDPDQSQFTRMFTERAVSFIERNKERPFFLYVPHVMPHVPIFASKKFLGRSSRGLYGDVVQELDDSVGQIVAAVQRAGLNDRTLVIFTSDNGPFLSYGNHAGSAGPLREGKLTTFEGGVRTPCIMRWTGVIAPERTSDAPISSIDFLPTFARLAGGKLPEQSFPASSRQSPTAQGVERPIDGCDAWPVIRGDKGATLERNVFFYYSGEELQAVRQGDFKLHLAHPYLTSATPPGREGRPANFANMKPESMTVSGIKGIASRHGYVVAEQPQALYDLKTDVGETRDVAAEHPEVVKQLLELAEQARADLGDSLTMRKGSGVRPVGRVE